uniref:Nucleolar GTP-binding protein 1 Rossman-fold domain-containing protein n=1 Tax=Hucho hucho TaxID=62062 RepID=A0A4W5QQH9_9TELE
MSSTASGCDVRVGLLHFRPSSLHVCCIVCHQCKYLLWSKVIDDCLQLVCKVVDTQGIMDHPLEERNTIEMQAITALAHLRSAVLYVMDVSERCGQTLEHQHELFNIQPLFANKPLLIVANKCDVKKICDLTEEDQKIFADLTAKGIPVIETSALTEEGVIMVKTENIVI